MSTLAACLDSAGSLAGLALASLSALVGLFGTFALCLYDAKTIELISLEELYYRRNRFSKFSRREFLRGGDDDDVIPSVAVEGRLRFAGVQAVLLLVASIVWISAVLSIPFLHLNIEVAVVVVASGFLFGYLVGKGLWMIGVSRIFKIRATMFDLFDDDFQTR